MMLLILAIIGLCLAAVGAFGLHTATNPPGAYLSMLALCVGLVILVLTLLLIIGW